MILIQKRWRRTNGTESHDLGSFCFKGVDSQDLKAATLAITVLNSQHPLDFIRRLPMTFGFVFNQSGLITLVIAASMLIFVRSRIRGANKRPYPPGPKRLPVIGSMLEMPHSRLWETVQEWGKIYGARESSSPRSNWDAFSMFR